MFTIGSFKTVNGMRGRATARFKNNVPTRLKSAFWKRICKNRATTSPKIIFHFQKSKAEFLYHTRPKIASKTFSD